MPPSLSFLVLPRVDSIMLVEEGFNVTSVDASDKMLKYALKERWNRRHDPAFDKWGTWVQPGVLSSPYPGLLYQSWWGAVFLKGGNHCHFPEKGALHNRMRD